MWVEFVVGSRLCSEGFLPGSPVFLPLQKNNISNINSNSAWKHSMDMPLQISIYFID